MREPTPFGRYVLVDRIAVGGMAEVYVAARPEEPGRLYAVKRILPTLAEDDAFLTMFLDEARLVVQLDHPGISPVHELGKHGGGYYMAMEYLAGKDLRALVDATRGRGERLPVAMAAGIAARVADALDHAHRSVGPDGAPLQVVHRDVSPANILVGFDGTVRVIDFGIAQAAIRTRREDTVLRGKFGYMSPEMAAGATVDRRSDVFALGAVLHELLTGERLFAGGSELATLERVRAAEVPPPSARRPDLPRGLDAVVLKALARDPAGRYAWASELRDALLPFARRARGVGEPPALARLMARTFPDDLRVELDRVERARGLPLAPVPRTPEETQVIALGPGPGARPSAPPPGRTGHAPLVGAATLAALALAGLFAALQTPPYARVAAGASAAAPAPAAVPAALQSAGKRRGGRLVVQPLVAATLVVDGTARIPPLGAGEQRVLELPPGEHRVELRTEDGRRTGATVILRAGETSELIGVKVE